MTDEQPFAVQAAKFSLWAPIGCLVMGLLTLSLEGPGKLVISLALVGLYIAAFILGIVALFGMRKHGRKGILVRGILGVTISGVGIVAIVLGAISGYANARAAARQSEVRASDEIDFGSVENSVYRNQYFGLTVTLPPEWSVQDQESRRRLMQEGAKTIAGDNQELRSAIKASEMTTVNLVTVFRYPLDTPVPFNPSIMAIAERVAHFPERVTARDYLVHVKALLARGSMETALSEKMTVVSLGGREFDLMTIDVNMGQISMQQNYYVAITKGYALGFIATFSNEEEEAALQEILDSVTFD